MERLIDKYDGDFRKVCEHYANSLKEALGKDKDKFIDWMYATKEYSESQWKRGLFGDAFLYLHCFDIHKKLHGDSNQHHIVLVSGKIGKGKSTLGAQICALVDPTLDMTRICYIPPHLFRRIGGSTPCQANLVDEGGNFFKSRNAMTKLGKDVSQAFQLVRDLKQLIVICYDEPEKLDKDLIDKIDSLFVKVYDPTQSADNRYNGYYAYNVTALDRIKPFLKNKLTVTNHKITKHITWRGRNSKEFPKMNDITEDVYRSEKRKYLKSHMLELAKKYSEEFEENSKPELKEQKTALERASEYLSVSQAAKALDKTTGTIRRWARTNKIKHIKVGGSIMVLIDTI